MDAPTYLHLKLGDVVPPSEWVGPFKAVIVAEVEVTPEWRAQLSSWLIRNGCRYMMAWGLECADWELSVDEAGGAIFDYGDISDDDFVMTTSHQSESLQEPFWFSKRCAQHPSLELDRTFVIHVSPSERAAQILQTFQDAQNAT